MQPGLKPGLQQQPGLSQTSSSPTSSSPASSTRLIFNSLQVAQPPAAAWSSTSITVLSTTYKSKRVTTNGVSTRWVTTRWVRTSYILTSPTTLTRLTPTRFSLPGLLPTGLSTGPHRSHHLYQARWLRGYLPTHSLQGSPRGSPLLSLPTRLTFSQDLYEACLLLESLLTHSLPLQGSLARRLSERLAPSLPTSTGCSESPYEDRLLQGSLLGSLRDSLQDLITPGLSTGLARSKGSIQGSLTPRLSMRVAHPRACSLQGHRVCAHDTESAPRSETTSRAFAQEPTPGSLRPGARSKTRKPLGGKCPGVG